MSTQDLVCEHAAEAQPEDQVLRLDAQLEALPSLTEKFVIDFANGIDVVNDHIDTQQSRSGFFMRMYESFNGTAHRRQNEINASLAKGVEASLTWLTELTEELASSNLAISRVNERIIQIRQDLNAVAHYSTDTRDQLNRFIQETTSRLDGMNQEILRIDGEQRAHRHLDRVFAKWAAGGYARFSCLQRLYAALEDLYWGDFGACLRHHMESRVRNDLISHLESKAVIQIRSDRKITGDNEQRTPLDEWIALPASSQPLDQEALTWLGDWSSEDTPLSYTATHPDSLLVVGVPRRLDSSRAVDMIHEFFEVRE
jgi:hypothetical protein